MIKSLALSFVLAALASHVFSQPSSVVDFVTFVSNGLDTSRSADSQKPFENICPIGKSAVARRLLVEYGSMFIVDKVVAPPACIFANQADVDNFQSKLNTQAVVIDGTLIVLQKAAAESLIAVLSQAQSGHLRIRPLDGRIAGGRTYEDTLRLWNSRLLPALRAWTAQGRIDPDESKRIAKLPIEEQIDQVIKWENSGLFFGPGRAKSIFSSVAPPGASQHLSLFALDIAPPITPSIRWLMNAHGWFQTVKGDEPHFTFLGAAERDLPGRGVKAVLYNGTQYWIPNVSFGSEISLPN
jgi:hypothetical protein